MEHTYSIFGVLDFFFHKVCEQLKFETYFALSY